MRSGKISESILKRSVLKEIHTKNSNVISGAGVGSDAAIIKCEGEMVAAATTVTLGEGFWGKIGVQRVMNDIACMGGCMDSVLMNITLPEDFDERQLKIIMRGTEEICNQFGIQIAGGHTEISEMVAKPLVSYTGIGRRQYDIARKIKPGHKIAVTKWIGMEGAYLLTEYRKEALNARFSRQLLEVVENGRQWLSVLEEAKIAAACGVSYLHNLSNGGILNGLWELAVCAKSGINVDFKKIPVRQEIIEVCELFDINPYQLLSGGSLLMTIPDGCEVIERLKEAEIPVCIIGEVTDRNDKILVNDDEIRYLDVPGRDELWKIVRTTQDNAECGR